MHVVTHKMERVKSGDSTIAISDLETLIENVKIREKVGRVKCDRRCGTGFCVGTAYVMTAYHICEESLGDMWTRICQTLLRPRQSGNVQETLNIAFQTGADEYRIGDVFDFIKTWKKNNDNPFAKILENLKANGKGDVAKDIQRIAGQWDAEIEFDMKGRYVLPPLKLDFEVPFCDIENDIIVLKLKDKAVTGPLLLWTDNLKTPTHLIGFPKDRGLIIDPNCKLYTNCMEDELQKDVDKALALCKNVVNDSNKSNLTTQYTDMVKCYQHFAILRCSQINLHRASGSPVVIFGENFPKVQAILLKGEPTELYKPLYSEKVNEISTSVFFEKGLSMSKLFDLMSDHADLRDDLYNDAVTYTDEDKDLTTLAKYIRNNTMTTIEEHSSDPTFVSTYAVEKGLEILYERNIVIYRGKSGQGKSKNSMEVMRRYQGNHKEFIMLNPEFEDIKYWDHFISENIKTVVLLNDCFGKTNVNQDQIYRSEPCLKKIFSCTRNGNIKLIMTIHSNVFEQCSQFLAKYKYLFAEESIIDISHGKYKLTREEKSSILQRHCGQNNIQSYCKGVENYKSKEILNKSVEVRICNETTNNILGTDPLEGFPETCRMFCSDRNCTVLGYAYFIQPSIGLQNKLDEMRKAYKSRLRYSILVYLMLEGGESDLGKSLEKNALFSKVRKSVDSEYVETHKILDAAEDMENIYILRKESNVFHFQHDTLSAAVAMSYGKCNPKLLFQECGFDFLLDFVKMNGYKKTTYENVLIIGESTYLHLINRFIADMERGKSTFERFWWMNHCAVSNDEFLSQFTRCISNKKNYSLLAKSCKAKDGIFAISCKYSNIALMEKLWDIPQVPGYISQSTCYLLYHKPIVRREGVHIQVAFWLLKRNVGLKYLYNIFKYLSEEEHVEVFVYLLNHVDINKELILPVLNRACFYGEIKLVITIMERYIHFMQQNESASDVTMKHGITKRNLSEAVSWACMSNNPSVIQLLLNKDRSLYFHADGEMTNLNIASFFGRFRILEELVKLGYSQTESQREYGLTNLELAVIGLRHADSRCYFKFNFSNVNCIYEFINKICKPKSNSKDLRYKNSKVYFNEVDQFYSIIDLLIKQSETDLKVLKGDENGNSLGHYSVILGFDRIIEILKERHTWLLTCTNMEKLKPIHLAAYFGRKNIFNVLYAMQGQGSTEGSELTKMVSDGKQFVGKSFYINDKNRPNLLHYLKNAKVNFGSEEEFTTIENHVYAFRPLA